MKSEIKSQMISVHQQGYVFAHHAPNAYMESVGRHWIKYTGMCILWLSTTQNGPSWKINYSGVLLEMMVNMCLVLNFEELFANYKAVCAVIPLKKKIILL